MAVFRVEKTKDYTVMSNHHLRNTTLSLKAKGLLSLMLSLPDNWDYTTKGLACICKDGVDSISAAIKELEVNGYLTRQRFRDRFGRLGDIEYTIHESPIEQQFAENSEQTASETVKKPKRGKPTLDAPVLGSPILEEPILENPILDMPEQENPDLATPKQEKHAQLNTYLSSNQESITEKSNTDLSNIYQSITNQSSCTATRAKEIDEIDRIDSYKALIKDNIEYDCLCERYGEERLDEVVEIMLETMCTNRKTIRVGSDDFPTEVVKIRLLKLNSCHVEYVFECIDKNTTKVYNIRNYLLTALYRSPTTMDTYYRAEVNHDFYGRK